MERTDQATHEQDKMKQKKGTHEVTFEGKRIMKSSKAHNEILPNLDITDCSCIDHTVLTAHHLSSRMITSFTLIVTLSYNYLKSGRTVYYL